MPLLSKGMILSRIMAFGGGGGGGGTNKLKYLIF
jgi:hypothetical protein